MGMSLAETLLPRKWQMPICADYSHIRAMFAGYGPNEGSTELLSFSVGSGLPAPKSLKSVALPYRCRRTCHSVNRGEPGHDPPVPYHRGHCRHCETGAARQRK